MIGAQFQKMGDMTLTTPLLGVVCHRGLGFDTVYLHAKFDVQPFQRYHWGRRNLKWVT